MFRLVLAVTLVALGYCVELFSHNTFSCGSVSHMLSDFHPEHIWSMCSLDCVHNPSGSGNVLRAFYKAHSYSHTKDIERGCGFYARPTSHRDSMLLSYDVYFDNNFDWVKGGKLPGLWGGETQTCSGGRHSDDCFTTRFMWRENGQGEIYAYITKDQESNFCHRDDVECNFDYGNSLGRGKWHFHKGRWQNIAQYVHLNRPGHQDGYIKVFLDGHQVYEITNIGIRGPGRSDIHIDGMYFATFFGGSSSEWATPHDTHTYFKNFVFSTNTSPIGK